MNSPVGSDASSSLTSLVSELAEPADHVTLAARQAHVDNELLVVLLVHDHVFASRRTDHVPPDPVRPPGVVYGDVEERRCVGRPGAAVEGVRDLVWRYLASAQVLEAHREALFAVEVSRVRQQVAVGADVEGADGEERVFSCKRVAIEQDLLAVKRAAVRRHRRPGVLRPDGPAAANRVLLTLHGAGVIPRAALAVGHRQVSLLGPRLDLAEDRLAQSVLPGCHRLGIGVLSLEECDRLRIVLLGQPGVLIDDRVAVMGPLGRHALGGRRLGIRAVPGNLR